MSTKFFNRKDETVKKDALSLTEAQFIAKYKDQTKDEVLKTVWTDYNKSKKRKAEIEKQTTEGSDLVAVSIETREGVEHTNMTLPAGNGQTIKVYESDEVTQKPNKKGKKDATDPTSEEPVSAGKDKPGRTPRMRELIADKKYGKDKAKVKAKLEEEGFTCTGSGFHSEWNRVSKAAK